MVEHLYYTGRWINRKLNPRVPVHQDRTSDIIVDSVEIKDSEVSNGLVFYKITVNARRTLKGAHKGEDTPCTWTVKKRFSDFYDVYIMRGEQRIDPNGSMPQFMFPSRDMNHKSLHMTSLSEDQRKERAAELNKWLNEELALTSDGNEIAANEKKEWRHCLYYLLNVKNGSKEGANQ